ncbi:unnamed protein product [Cylindrotheca closterium]|uniref:Uncharacterized protein n=1 Tax=Cylindrotheca closterium TaxID=2856 RepID=A0AAD2G5Y2_9STRA|nr:unnamed protein product [Cylindrotheca closterium]
MTSFPKLLGPESPQMGTQFLSSVSICFSDDSIHQAIHDKKRPKKLEIQASFGFAVPTDALYGQVAALELVSRWSSPWSIFSPNSPPVIGFGASPVSTTFNGQDAVHRGAPKWSDCFDPTLIQQYWQGDRSVPTHSLVISLIG